MGALRGSKVVTPSCAEKSSRLDFSTNLQCVAAQGLLGHGLLRGGHSGNSSSHRENMIWSSFHINNGGEVARVSGARGSCSEAIAAVTMLRFMKSSKLSRNREIMKS